MDNDPKQPNEREENAAGTLIILYAIPILVFVLTAWACHYLLPESWDDGPRMVLSLAVAAILTMAVLYIIRALNQRPSKDRHRD
jgi:uncharacterized membrane protein YoaK (UPF0700 family)